MVLKISKEIQEKFKGKGNLFEMDKPLRDEYYREIETFQDTYFFYKNKEKGLEIKEDKVLFDFFNFLYKIGDFLTPLFLKDILFFFKEKEYKFNLSFLLLNCCFLFDEWETYENILNFLDKNYEHLKEKEKIKLNFYKFLFNLLSEDKKTIKRGLKSLDFLNSFEKEDKEIFKTFINLIYFKNFELYDFISKELGFLELNYKKEEINYEDLKEKYLLSIKKGNPFEEKFFREIFLIYLKDNPLNLEKLYDLSDFISKIDTYFLKPHNIEVRNMVIKISEIGKKIWKNNLDFQRLEMSAYLHDIGKILIPWILMDKKIPLNKKEKERFQKHSNLGYEILKKAKLEREALFVLEHHEYLNGKGYPNGKINPTFEGNLLCLSESFIGAVNGNFMEKEKREISEILIEFKHLRGIYFYPEIVDALLLMD